MTATMHNGLTPVQSQPTQTPSPNARDRQFKSTATAAQHNTIVLMLRAGVKNTMELRRAGVMMPAARIKELNEKLGYCILRIDLRDLWDEWGFCHPRVAVYELISEPDCAGAT
jgi:Helix-turn-helix domain